MAEGPSVELRRQLGLVVEREVVDVAVVALLANEELIERHATEWRARGTVDGRHEAGSGHRSNRLARSLTHVRVHEVEHRLIAQLEVLVE